ncbi:MAG: flagellar FliJ family protein [Planctomycetota bacterium]
MQRVLDVKTREEQQKRAELLEITESLAQTRRELLIQEQKLSEVIEGIAGESPPKRINRQEFFLKYSTASDEQIKRLKDKVRTLEAYQREKTTELLRVKRSKEGLEKLRAEAKRQHIEKEERLEQKELDEMAGISFSRKRKAGIEQAV